ncbi:MAG: cyclase family protein [Armatimonadota bacterium]
MKIKSAAIVLAAGMLLWGSGYLYAQRSTARKGWTQGKGYGWVWGPNDEVGALNTLGPADVREAMSLVRQGKVYDMGLTYDRTSFKWPGHAPGEIMTFRGPEGVKRQKDLPFTQGEGNSLGTAWHSCALFMSDNVATQIDSLGHITQGRDNHWYNGFKEADWGGNWGIRKCGAETIPPIVCRGVMIDVAGLQKVDALPAGFRITPKILQDALRAQKTEIRPGDAVFIRTGTARYWGETGADHAKLREHDTAGIDLDAAKWLVEQKGAVLVGSDTSGLEVAPVPEGSNSFNPVHDYLLVRQGVHIAEFHNLEELAKDRAYEFAYVCSVNKIKGATAGFALRPIAMR